MKRIIYCLCALCLLASCHTPLTVATVERISPQVEKPNMEFIGFKNMNRNNTLLRDFGSDLESTNIALNKQNFYLGTFSFSDIEDYPSTMRYVTFVDVVRHLYSHDDAVNDNYDMWLAGISIATISFGTLFPVYVPLVCAWDKNDCEINLKGQYNIVVYDKQEHKVVATTPFEVDIKDDYKGQYGHKKTDTRAVDSQYKNRLLNTFIEQYLQVYNHIDALQ